MYQIFLGGRYFYIEHSLVIIIYCSNMYRIF